MTPKEQMGVQVLNSLLAEQIVLDQAAELMGVSTRHARRITTAYRERGAAALAHGHRGRRPVNATSEAVTADVVHSAGRRSEQSAPAPSTQAHARIRVDRNAHPVRTGHGRTGYPDDIRPLSPQAKGRVERAAGIFQDRLITELRLAGATTIEQAKAVLKQFLPRYNRRFQVPAQCPDPAFRPLPPDLRLGQVLCFKHKRRVARDNTVQFQRHTLQLLPDRQRRSYAGAAVVGNPTGIDI